jgi:type VI secretion system protein ImpL
MRNRIAGFLWKLVSLPKVLLMGLIRRPRLLVGLGIVSLCALIWFAGDLAGMQSPEIRLLLIAGIILAWVFFLVFDHYRAQQGAQLLEESLQQQGVEQFERFQGEEKDKIEAVQLRFEKAIATLKQSKLGKGYRGKAALYALPWYMIVGPSASGKSTALRESGLQFPSLGENPKGVQGVGGTRNCDWWFTTDAVLLDTAGRYMTEDEDREEWFAFLDLLKKARSKKPINGVMVAIGINVLLEATDQLIEWHAKTIRDRIDELMTHLGMSFPVYLMFTKCDLLEGFNQFFGELEKSEREQIWGCTLPRRTRSSPAAHETFALQFNRLLEGIVARRLDRFSMSRGEAKLSILGFPLQLESCRPVLTRFVEILFHQNPYQQNPFFRGFYLTSGTQEGHPIDRIMDSIRQAAGLEAASVSEPSSVESKSYFIKNLFTDVIFPDQSLASPSSRAYRQRGLIRVAVFGLAIIGVGLSLFAMGSSYLGNKLMVHSIQDDSVKLVQIRREHQGSYDSPVFAQNLELLGDLQSRLGQIQDYRDHGVPFRLKGFYQADKLFDPLKTLYHRELSHLILRPTQIGLESRLSRFVNVGVPQEPVGVNDNYYDMFKAYLMLGDPEHLDSEFLAKQLKRLWKEGSPALFAQPGQNLSPELQENLNRNLDFFSRYLVKDYGISRNQDLVRSMRSILQQIPLKERLYQQTLQRASEGLGNYTLQAALEGYQQPHLISDYHIPGVFTKSGWTDAFEKTLDQVLDEYAKEYWVLGEQAPVNEQMQTAVQAKYFGDYSQHWFQFLASIHIRPNRAQSEVLSLYQGLTAPPSPIAIVFEDVQNNTIFGDGVINQVGEAATGLIEKMKRKIFSNSSPNISALSNSQENPIAKDFKPLHRFLTTPDSPEGAQSGLDQYLAELKRVQAIMVGMSSAEGTMADPVQMGQRIVQGEANELTKAMNTVDQLSVNFDLKTRQSLTPLLTEPILLAMQSVIDQALQALDRQWVAEVFEPCQKTIAPFYPFQASNTEVAIGDVAGFFSPDQGKLWAFVNQQLRPFIQEGDEGWTLKSWRGLSLPLSTGALESLRYAKFFSSSLFLKGQGTPTVPFELYPYSDQGPSASLVSHTRFKVGEQEFTYDMGPPEWKELVWPGPSGSAGSFLQVKVDGTWESRQKQGWWGLFRLLEDAQVTPKSESLYRVIWAWDATGGRPLRIQYDLRARRAENPFPANFFSKFSCLAHLMEAP